MTPRTSKNPNKIKDVELVNGRWVYRPFIPQHRRSAVRTDRRGRLAPPVKLGVESDPWHYIVRAHADAYEALNAESQVSQFSLYTLEKKYRESAKFSSLAKSTQKKSNTTRRILEHEIQINGKAGTLGELCVEEFTQPFIYQVREKRLKEYQSKGRDGRSHCNREISYLSAVVTWARKMFEEVTENPFRGIEGLQENEADRYVTDHEYWTQYDIAHEVADYLPIVFEMVYLLAQRGIEATDIELTDISDGLIRVRRRKGSKTTDIRIEPRHQAFIDACMALHKKRPVSGVYLLPGINGEKMNKSTIDDAMQRLKRLMAGRNLKTKITRTEKQDTAESHLFWTLHMLKAKGITDSPDRAIGGHKTPAMIDRYTRDTGVFDGPVQGKVIKIK